LKRIAVINVVGLSESCLGASTPKLNAWLQTARKNYILPAFPAVTCTAQSNYVTGKAPSAHGIVANGWYNREQAEAQFWKQSNHLVHGHKVWDRLKAEHPGFTCAKLFWWYNMYSTADYSITPRPMYPADGRKVFDIYTFPSSIRTEIKQELGEFPFPAFWGPAAGVNGKFRADEVSRWIAGSAKWIERKYQPTLSLIYLPHLDYNLQRLGPGHPNISADYKAIDDIVGDLLEFFRERGIEVILLSEYGISPVNQPIHLNRLFRERGWLTIKEELGLELLDAGASKVFAVADHQVAHIYIQDKSLLPETFSLLSQTPGVAEVLDAEGKKRLRIDHERSGDLIAISRDNAWFTYYYWLDDAKAPDFARCVDIHRKPGYDPVELFLNPEIKAPILKIGLKLLRKKLGFRMLMDLIPLDASLVKGSHGAVPKTRTEFPLLITPASLPIENRDYDSTEIADVIQKAVSAS
jgi:predicted AlkP superfamily pyrophosphatase or phosphodiesterase